MTSSEKKRNSAYPSAGEGGNHYIFVGGFLAETESLRNARREGRGRG